MVKSERNRERLISEYHQKRELFQLLVKRELNEGKIRNIKEKLYKRGVISSIEFSQAVKKQEEFRLQVNKSYVDLYHALNELLQVNGHYERFYNKI